MDKNILRKAIRTTFTNQIQFAMMLIYFLVKFNDFGISLTISGWLIALYFAYNREAGKF